MMRIRINPDYCKGCNLCIEICPRKVFEKGDEPSDRGYIQPKIVHEDGCPNYDRKREQDMICELCILICPDQAISWEEVGEVEE